MRAIEVARALNILHSGIDVEFTTIVTDSRNIKGGELFVALIGERFNGHDFVKNAVEAGVAGVVVSEDIDVPNGIVKFLVNDTLKAYQEIAKAYRKNMKRLHVLAITGSNGKTSTKDMVSACLAEKYTVVKTEASFNNEIGLPQTIFNIKQDTQFAVLEMGMRGLNQIRTLCDIAVPETGIITSVTETHMELLGSIDNIAKAKAEITEQLPTDGFAILNGDNEYVRKAAENTVAQVFYFGMNKENDYYATDITMNIDGTSFHCVEKCTGRSVNVSMPVLGLHNVYNALCAITVARCYDVDINDCVKALAKVELTNKRLQVVNKAGIVFIDDSYNASPASMQGAIKTLKLVKDGIDKEKHARSIAVLSDMLELGNVSREAHKKVGLWCAENEIDYLFVYGNEVADTYFEAKKNGVCSQYCKNLYDVVNCLEHVVREGDIVLLKGSHSMEVGKVLDYFG